MPKRLAVASPYPNLRGKYVETGTHEGRPAFSSEEAPAGGSGRSTAQTWIFYSTKFGRGPCWYFGRSLPERGSLSSFCCSEGDTASPEDARWPPDDIAHVKEDDGTDPDVGLPLNTRPALAAGASPSAAPYPGAGPSSGTSPSLSPGPYASTGPSPIACAAPVCAACRDLQGLSAGLECAACTPASADASARTALSLLKDHASSASRQSLARGLVSGDADAKQVLDTVAAAHQASRLGQPLILVQPPLSLKVGAGTVTLSCEAFCLSGAKVQYHWHKDGVPIRRAERPRYMLCGGSATDQGSYTCHVSAVDAQTRTRACEVQLSETAQRFESPMRRAAEAESRGDLQAAVSLLAEAVEASQGQSDAVCANAYCKRAELLLHLERWDEAFHESAKAIRLSPGLAKAHAARGTASVKLNLLAEAVSSWETAELLGGIPEATQEADACRQRLQQFFAEKQARKPAPCADEQRNGDADENAGDDWEESWRQAGWRGRSSGASARDFFGGQAGGFSGGSNRAGAGTQSAELQRNLRVLQLDVGAGGALPSEDEVRKAYRRLALQAHPDKPGGSKAAFQELQNAYEAVLKAAGAA